MGSKQSSESASGFWPRFAVLTVVVLWVSLVGGNWVGKYLLRTNPKFAITNKEDFRNVNDQRSRLRGRAPVTSGEAPAADKGDVDPSDKPSGDGVELTSPSDASSKAPGARPSARPSSSPTPRFSKAKASPDAARPTPVEARPEPKETHDVPPPPLHKESPEPDASAPAPPVPTPAENAAPSEKAPSAQKPTPVDTDASTTRKGAAPKAPVPTPAGPGGDG